LTLKRPPLDIGQVQFIFLLILSQTLWCGYLIPIMVRLFNWMVMFMDWWSMNMYSFWKKIKMILSI